MNLFGNPASKVIALNCLLFVTLIIVHEFGHFAVGSALGCTARSLSFMESLSSSYVSMSCGKAVDTRLIYFGGIAANALFSLAFLRIPSGRNLFFIAIGMSLVFSSLDFANSFYLLTASGLPVMFLGEYGFSTSLLGSRINIFNGKEINIVGR